MKQLAESASYIIFHEYETVFLKIKNTAGFSVIGDFYGDPEFAVISENEKFCVMGGAGIIVYFLHEPFEEYQYNTHSAQWKEWGRGQNSDDTIWVTNAVFIDDRTIEIETEDMQKHTVDVYSLP